MTHVDLPNESYGGVAHQVHRFANALIDRGHDVTVFTFSPPDPDCRYRVHQYPSRPVPRPLKGFLFARRIARTDFSGFDIIHTHGDNYLLSAHPQVRTFYGSAIDEAQTATSWKRRSYQRLVYALEKVCARRADLSVGISSATKARFAQIDKIVPCGVDTSSFSPLGESQRSEQPSIFFVGTARGRKRGQFLADTFASKVRSHLPHAELWAVSDSPLHGEGVVNHGRVEMETLHALYRGAWAFCLPSTYEGFGVPYIEAMASGTPVLASPNPGAREILCDGEFGIVADDGELGARLFDVLSDHELRASLASRGLKRAQDFSWDTVVLQYEAIYKELLGG